MSSNIKLLESFMNYCSDKSKVINQNIANLNTADYKRRDVNFQSYLQNQLNITSSPGNIENSSINSIVDDPFSVEDSGVNIEQEMSELAKNTINFKFASKRVSGYYKNLQNVIKSGG